MEVRAAREARLAGGGRLDGALHYQSERVPGRTAAYTLDIALSADGLLTAFTNARGFVSQYAYDDLGQLVRAQDPTGAVLTLARTDFRNDLSRGHVVTLTTPLGRQTRYQVEFLTNGDERLLNTFPDGTQAELVIRTDRTRTTRFPDGTVTTIVEGPDARWDMQVPLAQSINITTPGGLSYSATTQQSATLANPGDRLSLQDLTETVSVNGRAFTTTYSGSTRTVTNTTPEGRQSTIVLDASGRVVREQIALGRAARYGLEFTGPNRRFANPNGTGPDAVKCLLVDGTDLTVSLEPSAPTGTYEVRVAGVSATGELVLVRRLSDAVTVILGAGDLVPAITAPTAGSVLSRGTAVAVAWTARVGTSEYLFEFTGADRRFANPNGTAPDPVNGLGGAGGGLVVFGLASWRSSRSR